MAATAAVLRLPICGASSTSNPFQSIDTLSQSTPPPFGSTALSSGLLQLEIQIALPRTRNARQTHMGRSARAVASTEGISEAAEGMSSEAENGNGLSDGTQFLRPHLLTLAPYTPIEPFEVSGRLQAC